MAAHPSATNTKEIVMSRSRKFTLVRLANARHLTQGPDGHYDEIGGVLQPKPGDI
jgi:hypothetical protein